MRNKSKLMRPLKKYTHKFVKNDIFGYGFYITYKHKDQTETMVYLDTLTGKYTLVM